MSGELKASWKPEMMGPVLVFNHLKQSSSILYLFMWYLLSGELLSIYFQQFYYIFRIISIFIKYLFYTLK